MKPSDVDRLLRSAGQAADDAAGEAPFGFETRVVAAWRNGGNGNGDFAELSRFIRRAGAIASAVLVIATAAAYRQYRADANFAAVATNEYAIVDSAIQTEFSQ